MPRVAKEPKRHPVDPATKRYRCTQCPEDKPKTFSRQSDLNRHMGTHLTHEDKIQQGLLHICPFACGISDLQTSNVKTHVLSKHVIHHCNQKQCNFHGDRKQFVNHLKTHHFIVVQAKSRKLFEYSTQSLHPYHLELPEEFRLPVSSSSSSSASSPESASSPDSSTPSYSPPAALQLQLSVDATAPPTSSAASMAPLYFHIPSLAQRSELCRPDSPSPVSPTELPVAQEASTKSSETVQEEELAIVSAPWRAVTIAVKEWQDSPLQCVYYDTSSVYLEEWYKDLIRMQYLISDSPSPKVVPFTAQYTVSDNTHNTTSNLLDIAFPPLQDANDGVYYLSREQMDDFVAYCVVNNKSLPSLQQQTLPLPPVEQPLPTVPAFDSLPPTLDQNLPAHFDEPLWAQQDWDAQWTSYPQTADFTADFQWTSQSAADSYSSYDYGYDYGYDAQQPQGSYYYPAQQSYCSVY